VLFQPAASGGAAGRNAASSGWRERFMKILMSLSAVLLLVLAGSAQAGTLAAGPMQGDTFLCNVVNVGPDIINSFNGDVLESEACDTVEPNTECVAFLSDPGVIRAFCRVTSSAAATLLRGNLVVGLGLSEFSFDLR
jgi:hypothetical protein